MMTLAVIMDDGGEVYAPIFERLEQELAALDRRDSAVERARRLARGRQMLPQALTPPAGL